MSSVSSLRKRVLVVTDQGCKAIGDAFAEAAREVGTEIETWVLTRMCG